MNTVRYLFFWGRTAPLSKLEAYSLLPGAQFSDLTPQCSVGTCLSEEEIEKYVHDSGGVIKIALVKNEVKGIRPDDVSQILLHELENNTRIVFAVNSMTDDFQVDTFFLESVKKKLTDTGASARFLYGKNGVTSDVAIDKEHATEIVIAKNENGYIIAETLFLQEYEAWSKREYGRPYSDAKKGMLPLKVSRMIVNIARPSEVREKKILLDPFCGMGSVLGEALLCGWSIIGSDISTEVVEKGKKNIEWLTREYGVIGERSTFIVSDATHISEHIRGDSVDAIVTEPFMGSTLVGEGNVSPDKVKNIARGLEKLYIGCLKDWTRLLRPKGIVIIAIPKFYVSGRIIDVKNVVDRCEMLGYTTKAGPIEYSRPQAKVRREFFVFVKR